MAAKSMNLDLHFKGPCIKAALRTGLGADAGVRSNARVHAFPPMFLTVVKLCQNSAAWRTSQLPGVSSRLLEDILDERTVDVKKKGILYIVKYI